MSEKIERYSEVGVVVVAKKWNSLADRCELAEKRLEAMRELVRAYGYVCGGCDCESGETCELCKSLDAAYQCGAIK